MFVQPRRPRRTGRFRSGRMRTERERREYVLSLLANAAVKTGLAIALVVAAVQAYRATTTHAAGVSLALRLFMPLAFAAGGLLALRSGIRAFRDANEIRAAPLIKDDEDDPGTPSAT